MLGTSTSAAHSGGEATKRSTMSQWASGGRVGFDASKPRQIEITSWWFRFNPFQKSSSNWIISPSKTSYDMESLSTSLMILLVKKWSPCFQVDVFLGDNMSWISAISKIRADLHLGFLCRRLWRCNQLPQSFPVHLTTETQAHIPGYNNNNNNNNSNNSNNNNNNNKKKW